MITYGVSVSLGVCHQDSRAGHHIHMGVVQDLEVPAGVLIGDATAAHMGASRAAQGGICMPDHRILHLGKSRHSQRRRTPDHTLLHRAHRRQEPEHTVSTVAAAERVAKGADTPWVVLAG